MTPDDVLKKVELTVEDFATLSSDTPDYPAIVERANEIVRHRVAVAMGTDCYKCGSLRKQRDEYICKKVDLDRKLEEVSATLHKRIETVSADRHTRDDELRYITYDLNACLDVIGRRPEDTGPTYGGPEEQGLFSSLAYVRDMLQANVTFYSRKPKP